MRQWFHSVHQFKPNRGKIKYSELECPDHFFHLPIVNWLLFYCPNQDRRLQSDSHRIFQNVRKTGQYPLTYTFSQGHSKKERSMA